MPQSLPGTSWSWTSRPRSRSRGAKPMTNWVRCCFGTCRVPDAYIVHDRFHVSQYLGEAVDKVRRQENKELMAQGDETLKGTRQLWLYNPENFSSEQMVEFSTLKDLHLKVARAWAAKEMFSHEGPILSPPVGNGPVGKPAGQDSAAKRAPRCL
jgi:hypothetical protein